MANTDTEITTANLTNLLKLNTAYEVKQVAATETTIDDTETFYFALPAQRIIQRVVVLVEVAASHGSVSAQVLAGNAWAAKAQTAVACPQAKTTAFSFEPGMAIIYKAANAIGSNDKEIQIRLTPASGKKLQTDHVAKITVILVKGNDK